MSIWCTGSATEHSADEQAAPDVSMREAAHKAGGKSTGCLAADKERAPFGVPDPPELDHPETSLRGAWQELREGTRPPVARVAGREGVKMKVGVPRQMLIR